MQARDNGCCRLPRTLEGTEVLQKNPAMTAIWPFVRSQRVAGVWGYSTAKSMAFIALQHGFPRQSWKLTPVASPQFL
jgi:hypothetical protein